MRPPVAVSVGSKSIMGMCKHRAAMIRRKEDIRIRTNRIGSILVQRLLLKLGQKREHLIKKHVGVFLSYEVADVTQNDVDRLEKAIREEIRDAHAKQKRNNAQAKKETQRNNICDECLKKNSSETDTRTLVSSASRQRPVSADVRESGVHEMHRLTKKERYVYRRYYSERRRRARISQDDGYNEDYDNHNEHPWNLERVKPSILKPNNFSVEQRIPETPFFVKSLRVYPDRSGNNR